MEEMYSCKCTAPSVVDELLSCTTASAVVAPQIAVTSINGAEQNDLDVSPCNLFQGS